MEKTNHIDDFETLNNIQLTKTTGSIFSDSLKENIKNVYKLNSNGDVIALNISNNSLKKIEGIFYFQFLEELYLNGNQFENLYILDFFPNLKILNASDNLINDNGIDFYFSNLEELYLNNNNLTKIPNAKICPKLKILSLKGNNINKYSYLDKYFMLEELNLDSNNIETIEGINIFPNLKKLTLQNNKIKKLQNLDLEFLEDLNFRGNQIKKIENLENLENLKFLILGNNIIEKIENLHYLKKLYYLNLSNNNIEDIENLENLENLRSLSLWGNKINKIQGLDKLINLDTIFFWKNNIQEIEGLSKLKALKVLDLSGNNLTKITKIKNLKNLVRLDLSSNRISKIEEISELKNLVDFNISENSIEDIKDCEELLKSEVKKLKIQDNPFLNNNSILLNRGQNHFDTIRNELEKLEKSKEEIILPVKVMLLGNHASGKSTFLNYFLIDKIENKNESTHILKIVNYPKYYKKRKSQLPSAIFYDFGGQDYYHGVYQAFLTLNTINLLFWQNSTDNISKELDSKKEKIINFNKQYWLQQIDFANSQRKKYFLDTTEEINYTIQTHSDSSNQQNPIEGNIRQTFYVSLLANLNSKKNEFALKHLKETIKEEIKLHSKLEKKTKNEINLYRFISEYKKDDWINVKDLVKTYDSSLGNLKAELEQLSMKGMILYYKNITSLENYVWLNPSKTVEKIHEILSVQKKGKIEKGEFEKQINDKIIIGMLKENKVIFFDDYDNHYIIPGYLDFAHEDKDEFFYFAEFDSPNFILKFLKFIPFGLINQLICHFGKNPEKKVYWRNQLVFTHQNARVRIKIDFEILEIRVFIKSQKKESLKEIVKDIFLDILYLYWDEKIPSLDDYETTNIQDEMEKKFYNEPKDLIKEKEKILDNQISDLYISINGGKSYIQHSFLQSIDKRTLFLNNFKFIGNALVHSGTMPVLNFKNFTNNNNIKSMKKIFISYSRKDVEFKNHLKNHLNILRTFDIADNWSCEEIKIGKWNDQIQQELEESDLIIYMLSANFFNSKYILEDEIQKGMSLIDDNPSKNILCIVVSDFVSLEKLNKPKEDRSELQDSILRLGDHQYLPYANIYNKVTEQEEEKIVALANFSRVGNINTAYADIVTKIQEILK